MDVIIYNIYAGLSVDIPSLIPGAIRNVIK